MSDGPSQQDIETAIVTAGGDPRLLGVHVERVLTDKPDLSPGEAVEELRAEPAMWPAFRQDRQPDRATMRTGEKAAFIHRHGLDAYLALPFGDR